jgi:hypothetical protein
MGERLGERRRHRRQEIDQQHGCVRVGQQRRPEFACEENLKDRGERDLRGADDVVSGGASQQAARGE